MDFLKLRLSDISPRCLIRMVWQNLWMVAASALILFMGVSLYFSWFHEPVYQADMTYAVTACQTSFTSSGNSTAAREVSAVLSEMLETSMVRGSIRESSEQLRSFDGSISASVVGSSNFVVVTVTDASPKRAYLALDAIIGLLPELTEYVSSNSVVYIIRNPAVSSSPVNQVDVFRFQLLAGAVGAMGMILFLCFYSLYRGTIQTRSAARRLLDGHIIASVHRERRKKTLRSHEGKKPLQVFAPDTSFAYTQQINAICTRIEHEAAVRGSQIFMITGVGENEGKSTIAANVAAALALMGKKVAILDCDMRNPSIYRFFDKKYTAPLPLNQMLAQPFSRENLLQCMQRHDKLGLFILCSRGADKRGAELLSGKTMENLLLRLRVFDYVILDTPPMGYFPEAEALAQHADATMLVVRQDLTSAPDINDCIDVLRSSGSAFLGCILNDMTASVTEGYGCG